MEYILDDSLRKGYRLAALIGFSMIFSVMVYAGVVEFISHSQAPFTGYSPISRDAFDILRLVLLGVCLIESISRSSRSCATASCRCKTSPKGRRWEICRRRSPGC